VCSGTDSGQRAPRIASSGARCDEVERGLQHNVRAPAFQIRRLKCLRVYGFGDRAAMDVEGKQVLIVVDELPKQARAYRAISCMFAPSAGPRAYPGDVILPALATYRTVVRPSCPTRTRRRPR